MDVTTAEFEAEVIERSKKTPVLVDFWAEWCAPCRMLGPVLEKLAAEPNAPFVLAKVDTDSNKELGARYQIRGIPAVKLFADGKVVAEFTGALPESSVREFLAKNLPSEADTLVSAGDFDAALAIEPGHPRALLGLARAAIEAGKLDEAGTHIAAINPRSDEAAEGQKLLEVMSLVQVGADAGGVDACRTAADANTDDIAARYNLACALVGSADYRGALEQFLQVVRQDKKWNDEAGRKAMLKVFNVIGIRSPLADEFRGELAMLL